jgi:hypothetical protein
MNVRAGAELGERIIEANAPRILALAGQARTQFVAGLLGAMTGGAIGMIGAPATALLLRTLADQTEPPDALPASTAEH